MKEKAKYLWEHPWLVGALFALCLLPWAFYPTAEYRERMATTLNNVKPADIIPDNIARVEIQKIDAEIKNFGTHYGAKEAFRHKKRLIFYNRRNPALDQEIGHVLWHQAEALKRFRIPGVPESYADRPAYGQQLELQTLEASPEFQELVIWRPSYVEPHFMPLLQYWWSMKLPIILVMCFYNIFMLLHRRMNLLDGVLNPLFWFSACCPAIGVWVFPTRDPAKQVARTSYRLACVLTLAIAAHSPSALKAQTSSSEQNDNSAHTLVLDDSPQKSVSVINNSARPGTLVVWGFADITGTASHDRQFILIYTHSSGFTLLQQNRQTSDRAATTSNFALGYTAHIRKHDFTALAGPAFNDEVRNQKAGYNHQPVMFLYGNIRTKRLQVFGLTKMMFGDESRKIFFGDRQIFSIRGPTENTPRWLQGVALEAENWHIQGPGKPRWIENMVGPMFNIGQVIGKPKGFWSDISVYPYRDFARPQPSHNRLWDVRLQWKHTFTLNHAR